MIQIVLDTSACYNDWFFKSPGYHIIKILIDKGGAKLLIPSVVRFEMIKHYQKQVDELKSTINKSIKDANRLHLKITPPKILAKGTQYESLLDKRLNELGAEIVNHNNISHDLILSKALNNKRPFQDSGKGYQDALIWQIILEKIAKNGIQTHFITNNYNDFGDPNMKLHPDLCADLTSNSLPEASVQLFCNFREYYEKTLTNELANIRQQNKIAARNKRKLLSNNEACKIVRDWYVQNRSTIQEQINIQELNLHSIASEMEDPTVVCLEDPEIIDIDQVSIIDDNIVLITAEISTTMSVQFFMPKSDYYSYDTLPFEVEDSDWNDYCILGSLCIDIPLHISLTYDRKSKEISEYEVNPNCQLWGYCRHCGSPIYSDAAEECGRCGQSLFK